MSSICRQYVLTLRGYKSLVSDDGLSSGRSLRYVERMTIQTIQNGKKAIIVSFAKICYQRWDLLAFSFRRSFLMAFLCIQDLIYYYYSISGILSNQFFHLECQMEIMYSSPTAATYHHHTTHDTIRCFCCCWCWLVGDGDLKYLNKCDIKYLSNKNTINKY